MGLFRRRDKRVAAAPSASAKLTPPNGAPPPGGVKSASKGAKMKASRPGKENASAPSASNASISAAASAAAAAQAAQAAQTGEKGGRKAKKVLRQAEKAARKEKEKGGGKMEKDRDDKDEKGRKEERPKKEGRGLRRKPTLLHKAVAAEKTVKSDRRRSVRAAPPVRAAIAKAEQQQRPVLQAARRPDVLAQGLGQNQAQGQTGLTQHRAPRSPVPKSSSGTSNGSSAGGRGLPSKYPHRDFAAALDAQRVDDADAALRRIVAAVTREGAPRDHMVADGLPATLIALLKSDVATIEMRRNVVFVIAELSWHDSYEPPLVEAGVISVLVWLINMRNVDDVPILTESCRALRNLLDVSQGTAVQATRYGCVEPLLAIMTNMTDADVVLEATAAIANLAHRGTRFQSYIIKHNGLNCLADLGKRITSDETMFHVINVLADFSRQDRWHRPIVAADALTAAFRALQLADDDEVVAEAGYLISNLAKTQKNRAAVRDAGGLVVLLNRLAQCATFTHEVPSAELTRAIANVCTDPRSASDALTICDGTKVLLRVYCFPEAPASLIADALRAIQVLAQGSATRRAKVLYAVGIHVKQAALSGKPTNRLYDLRQAILDDSRQEEEVMGLPSAPMPQTLERLSRASVKLMKSGVLMTEGDPALAALQNRANGSGRGSGLQSGERRGEGSPRPGPGGFAGQEEARMDWKRAQAGAGTDRSKFMSTGRVMSVVRKPRVPAVQPGPRYAHRPKSPGQQQTLQRQPTDLRQLASKQHDDADMELASGHEQDLSAVEIERARMLADVIDRDMSKELFEIGQVLGKGGYGSVMLAKNLGTSELVAIKSFHNSGTMVDKKAIKEQLVWKGLQHPNVVEFKGSFIGDNGNLNLVVEYVDGLSLAEHLAQYSAFPESLVAEIARQVLCGLEYLHASGVTHRDLKPANILVDNNAAVKICDFGVSSSENVQTINPGQQHMVGTPWYIAPELIEYRPYTKSVDIWSLGCTIMELATGRRPYHELSAMQVLFRMVEDQMPPIPSHLSSQLRSFLKACFVWDPEQRPSASELMNHPFIQMAKSFSPSGSTSNTR